MKSLVVLRNNLERRRKKLLWPGKEEDVDVTPQIISDIKQTRHNTDTQPDLRTPLTATSGWVLKYSKYILVYNLLTTSTTILETNSRHRLHQSLLQLPTEFLSIRPEVEEVVALLQRESLLLCQS